MQKTYTLEREGQIEFFNNYGIPWDNDEHSVLVDNTDGVWNGVLFEFKLNITNLNRVLFQAIKYLSRMRIRGESVPATILLVSLNDTTAYVYKSEDYRDAIQTVYVGASSKDNEGFVGGQYVEKIDYSNMSGSSQMRHLLKDDKVVQALYMPVDLDEDCIVGWAERYYRENPKASKGDFLGDDTGTQIRVIGEIRNPKCFSGHIRPYIGRTNEKFKYLMDCLNDRLSKKDLGAFYTPEPYCRKASELVQMAVERVPDGNDYIILDRCAGTGNLENALIGLYDKNGSELISHCVVSTYEYYEYKVLMERIGDKVREIIPPSEKDVDYNQGRVANADAMSKEYIENPIIRQYVDNPKCTIILFENPPYQDSIAISFTDNNGNRAKTKNTLSFVNAEYKKHSSRLNEGISSARDISNLFIWSGIHYYLRQETDSYIIFSPVKYFKNIGLCDNMTFCDGFLFNRKEFHASESSIGCVLWNNKPEDRNSFTLHAYNIVKVEGKVEYVKDIMIKKSISTFEPWFDRTIHIGDVENNVWCNREGIEMPKHKADVRSIYNDDIIANIGAPAFSIDSKNRCLVRCTYYHHGFAFPLRRDAYLYKLPMWVAKMFPQDSWYEKDVYNTTSDGGDAYTKDTDLLKSCLIYTCLSNQNKCLTFDGSDGRHYQNELCFDTDTLASRDLKTMKLDDEEQTLMDLWQVILDEAKQTKNYNPRFKYGVYQITKELNTFHEEVQSNGKNKMVPDYVEMNGNLDSLRTKLKEYYKSHITAKMFKYELLK